MKHEHAFVRYWRALNVSLEALGSPPVTLGEVSPLYEAHVSLRAAVDILADPIAPASLDDAFNQMFGRI
jgi:hypothetical protein